MFMFNKRSDARNFKAGRDGYVLKDRGSNVKEYRWAVVVPNPNMANARVYS